VSPRVLLRVKLALAVFGVAVFLYGMQTDQPVVRWVGIWFVFVAWVLRFWKRPSRPDPD
jgi:arginine exporter protein ArgO